MRQTLWLTAANLRAALAKPSSGAVVIASVGLTVLVLVATLAVGFGLSRMLALVAQPERALLLDGNARNEIDSLVVEHRLPALRHEAIVIDSPELVVAGMYRTAKRSGQSHRLMLRGVSASAYALRPEVEIVAGRRFETGRLEMIVGTRMAAEFAGFDIGDIVLTAPGAEYAVVGHFAAGGGPHESEAWADLPMVQSTHERPQTVSALWIRASQSSQLDAVRAAVQADERSNIRLHGEQAYFESRAERSAPIFWTLATVLGGLMAVGAGAAALCMSYWTVRSRSSEIATLRAMGFGRGVVALAMALETLALTVLGGMAGIAAAYGTFDGLASTARGASVHGEMLAFDLAVTPAVAGIGLAAAAAIGLVGALMPLVQMSRLRIAAALQHM